MVVLKGKSPDSSKRFHLEGHFGSYPVGDLVDDLGVKAAAVVHVSHHDWKRLNNRRVFVQQFKPQRKDEIHIEFKASHLCWTRLLRSNIRSTEPVEGISSGAQQHSVNHLQARRLKMHFIHIYYSSLKTVQWRQNFRLKRHRKIWVWNMLLDFMNRHKGESLQSCNDCKNLRQCQSLTQSYFASSIYSPSHSTDRGNLKCI